MSRGNDKESKKNPWMVSTIILGIIVLFLLVTNKNEYVGVIHLHDIINEGIF